ncbi:uncharacterized protein RAG0_08526 [Rhynchosporium agropyri]|uniref:Uncharacterized protein n=1 Tax=Rhynchosporium agropyri TaxID=914238 RepID=A0A1E1KR72_9HELO|nr:uncharacterized protein RAG0_08526 [Rhynchosporium agropyri]
MANLVDGVGLRTYDSPQNIDVIVASVFGRSWTSHVFHFEGHKIGFRWKLDTEPGTKKNSRLKLHYMIKTNLKDIYKLTCVASSSSWGKVRAMTNTATNLKSNFEGIPTGRLPKTFLEAALIKSDLKIRPPLINFRTLRKLDSPFVSIKSTGTSVLQTLHKQKAQRIDARRFIPTINDAYQVVGKQIRLA